MPPEIRVVRRAFPDPPAMDTAVAAALLEDVSSGVAPETFRLHEPPSVVAFSSQDRLAPGFTRAVEAARDRGFGAVLRLAGGRAAVFHEGTLAFGWTRPDRDPKATIRRRFEEISAIVSQALRELGIDARVGEVPGEYCPGEFSVNVAGRRKLMGVGQRLARSAAHVGGVLVVGGADRIRDVLVPVYGALDLTWDPTTVGSVQDEAPGLTWGVVADSVLAELARQHDLVEGELPDEVVERARRSIARYDPGA